MVGKCLTDSLVTLPDLHSSGTKSEARSDPHHGAFVYTKYEQPIIPMATLNRYASWGRFQAFGTIGCVKNARHYRNTSQVARIKKKIEKTFVGIHNDQVSYARYTFNSIFRYCYYLTRLIKENPRIHSTNSILVRSHSD